MWRQHECLRHRCGEHRPRYPHQQQGFVWLLLTLLVSASTWLWCLQSDHHNSRQQQHNAMVLAQAKLALLAYASEPIGLTECGLNCPRPGDLPCPDQNNDGTAETSCNNDSALLGRLPWKTLGLGDLRDAAGERLWYAVSKMYKNNTRQRPLNLDTPGGISLRDGSGQLSFDASQARGVVAVVIAPMQALQRLDGVQQQRTEATQMQADNYLDNTASEDNANLQDSTSNGLIQQATGMHFNDVLLALTASVMHRSMQQRVLGELKQLLKCNANCPALPPPADIADNSCLGNGELGAGQCLASSATAGRLPLNAQGWWPLGNSSHALSGLNSHHWFQQNGWREQVFYQPNAHAVNVWVAGEAQAGQVRADAATKAEWGNYLENISLQMLGITPASNLPDNDVMLTIPRP